VTFWPEAVVPAANATEAEPETKAGDFEAARVQVVLAEDIAIPLMEYAPALEVVAVLPAQLTAAPLTPTPDASRTKPETAAAEYESARFWPEVVVPAARLTNTEPETKAGGLEAARVHALVAADMAMLLKEYAPVLDVVVE